MNPLDISNIKLVLFDLDGTLIDTLPEIADATNEALAPLLNNNPIENPQVQTWIGNGAANLFKLALRHCGITEVSLQQEFDARWPDFQSAYAQRCGNNSTPYPEAVNCLKTLQHAGYRLGVITNKEGHFAHKVIHNHDMQDYFELVIAGDTFKTKKPDPQILWAAIEQSGLERTQALFIGDSIIDLQTGAAAGVHTWAVTYGYHNGQFDKPIPEPSRPERFISGFDELTTLLSA